MLNSVVGVLIGFALVNLFAWAIGSPMRLGWYDKRYQK